MNRKLLCVLLMCALTLVLMGCGDKYSEAVDVNYKFADATEAYIDALGKADNAQAAASAIDTYAAKMEKIAPKIKEIGDKYPELRASETIPEDLEKSREKVAEAGKKMGSAMMNMMKYMADPKVMEAQTRLQNAMAMMAPPEEE